VSRYQKGKTNLDFNEARDSEWQWHQLGHMQVVTSLQTDSQASTHHSVFNRPDALPAANQQRQSTEGIKRVSNKCIAVRKVATPAEVTFSPLPQPKMVLD